MGEMQIASTAVVKKPGEMTDAELEATVGDIGEVVVYLTRDEASYEEKCFAEEVKRTADVYRSELDKRRI